jgi:prepilin-type N-terminal cleavage/methylation domain-containing protein
MKKLRKRPDERGWTLVELIIVIIILGLIAGVAIPAYLDLTTNAKINACQAQQAAIKSAVLLYYAKNLGTLPDSLATGMFVDATIPTCPSGGTITYKKDTDSTFTVECSIKAHNTPATSP